MELLAIQMINAYLIFVMQASALHHQLLEFLHHQSKIEELHFALPIVTVVLESSVVAIDALQNQ